MKRRNESNDWESQVLKDQLEFEFNRRREREEAMEEIYRQYRQEKDEKRSEKE